jgi:hypothetical protein
MVQNPFAYRRPNHSIQSRAISAPRQHSNPHRNLLLIFLLQKKSYASGNLSLIFGAQKTLVILSEAKSSPHPKQLSF